MSYRPDYPSAPEWVEPDFCLFDIQSSFILRILVLLKAQGWFLKNKNERITHKHSTLGEYKAQLIELQFQPNQFLSIDSSSLPPLPRNNWFDWHYTRFSQVYHYPQQKVPAPEDKRKHREVIIFLCQTISLKLKLQFCIFVIFESLYISLHFCLYLLICVHIFASLYIYFYLWIFIHIFSS